jgi:hypothetical protein
MVLADEEVRHRMSDPRGARLHPIDWNDNVLR